VVVVDSVVDEVVDVEVDEVDSVVTEEVDVVVDEEVDEVDSLTEEVVVEVVDEVEVLPGGKSFDVHNHALPLSRATLTCSGARTGGIVQSAGSKVTFD
jgi:hypothetical protein